MPKQFYSEYIKPFSVLAGAGQVALWERVSGRVQDWRQNLRDQDANLRNAIQAAYGDGLKVAHAFKRIGPGWDTDDLEIALEVLQETRVRFLLAETVCRLV